MSYNPNSLSQQEIDDLVQEYYAKKKAEAEKKEIMADLDQMIARNGIVPRKVKPRGPL